MYEVVENAQKLSGLPRKLLLDLSKNDAIICIIRERYILNLV